MALQLREAVGGGSVSFTLRGGGPGVTSRVVLDLIAAAEAVEVMVGSGTRFRSSDRRYQDMVVVEDAAGTVGAGATLELVLRSVCGSGFRKLPPPVEGGVGYSLGDDFPVQPVLDAMDSIAPSLDRMADEAGMPQAQYRDAVLQYALWSLLDDDDDDDDDDEPFGPGIIESILRTQLPEEEKPSAPPLAANLWEGVDTTLKTLAVQAPDARGAITSAAQVM